MTDKTQDTTQNKSKENENQPKDGAVNQDQAANENNELNKGKDGKDYF